MPERKLDQVNQEWLLRSIAVNAAGPSLSRDRLHLL